MATEITKTMIFNRQLEQLLIMFDVLL